MEKKYERFDIEDDEIRIISKDESGVNDVSNISESGDLNIFPDEELVLSDMSEDDWINNASCEESGLPRVKMKVDASETIEYTVADFQNDGEQKTKQKSNRFTLWIWISVLIVFSAIALLLALFRPASEESDISVMGNESTLYVDSSGDSMEKVPLTEGFTDITSMIVDGEEMTIFKPVDAVPCLAVGSETLGDSDIVLIVEAAGIREDNGEILGSFVLNGNLISKGQSKSGYCAIIDSKIILGVDNSSPYLEKAIENDGYFFRQYPLVAGSQQIVNDSKASAYRKGLAMIDGIPVVVTSSQEITLNRFSQLLIKMGATEALNLIGSTSFGFAIDKNGDMIEFGEKSTNSDPNINFIVWKRR